MEKKEMTEKIRANATRARGLDFKDIKWCSSTQLEML